MIHKQEVENWFVLRVLLDVKGSFRGLKRFGVFMVLKRVITSKKDQHSTEILNNDKAFNHRVQLVHRTHSGFLDLSQLSRASLLKAAVAALLLLLRWMLAIVSEFFTTSMRPILFPVDKQPYGSILWVCNSVRLFQQCSLLERINGCSRCTWDQGPLSSINSPSAGSSAGSTCLVEDLVVTSEKSSFHFLRRRITFKCVWLLDYFLFFLYIKYRGHPFSNQLGTFTFSAF